MLHLCRWRFEAFVCGKPSFHGPEYVPRQEKVWGGEA